MSKNWGQAPSLGGGHFAGKGDLVGDPAADLPWMHTQPHLLGGLGLGERDHLHRFDRLQTGLETFTHRDPVNPGRIRHQTLIDTPCGHQAV